MALCTRQCGDICLPVCLLSGAFAHVLEPLQGLELVQALPELPGQYPLPRKAQLRELVGLFITQPHPEVCV